jgi:hypothetical protein
MIDTSSSSNPPHTNWLQQLLIDLSDADLQMIIKQANRTDGDIMQGLCWVVLQLLKSHAAKILAERHLH